MSSQVSDGNCSSGTSSEDCQVTMFLLSKQILRRGPNQLSRCPSPFAVRKSSNDTSRRAGQLAAYQAGGASQFVGDSVDAGVQLVTVRIAAAAIVNQRLHSSDANRHFSESLAPGTPETVADDHSDVHSEMFLQFFSQTPGGSIRIFRKKRRLAATIHVRNIHSAVRANKA